MSVVKSLLATALAFGFISVVGCSSDNDDTPADTSPPAISNLSHVDNEKVIGNRTITFTADVTDNSTLTVTMTHNGNPVTVTPSGDTYSASITLADRTNNTIVVSANDGTNSASQTIGLNYPFLAFTNGQAASVVIGQPNFDSFEPNQGGSPSANSFNGPEDLKVVNSRLYITDINNHRVLGFNAIPTANNTNADFVIGQDSFTTSTSGINSNQLDSPKTIAFGDNHFFIAHNSPGRIHHWTGAPESNVNAEFVMGQSGFVTGNISVCESNTFYSTIRSQIYADGKLVASDISGNRVYIWNSIPTTSGVAPDVILGQQSTARCAANDVNDDGVSESAPTASTLSRPAGVWSDGTRLVIADRNNNRVLIWNSFPTSNFQPANLVLGQPDFITAEAPLLGENATEMSSPRSVYSNGNQLFLSVGERILIWDSWPTNNEQAANRVLGHADLIGDIDNLGNNALLGQPQGLAVDGNKLLVVDNSNERVLIFEAP